MPIKYKFIRIPIETYKLYKNIQLKMSMDISRIRCKKTAIPLTKVFKAVASPQYNENFIQVDLIKLNKLVKQK